MNIQNIFISINAADFEAASAWWAKVLNRAWDRVPMPSCHEWELANRDVFQVLDNPDGSDHTSVTFRVADLDAEIARLDEAGISVPEPVRVEGFDTLRFVEFHDPEGNTVGLLDGV